VQQNFGEYDVSDDRQGQHADPVQAAQEAALGQHPLLHEHGPRAPGSPHDQAGAGVGLDRFDGAAQVAQLRCTVVKKGKKTVEVVYLITSDRTADPETLPGP
jgi:hypothetical protein